MEQETEFHMIEYLILKLLNVNEASPINGKIHAQKLLFLIIQNFDKLQEELDYKAHKLGPYSAALETGLEELRYMGDIVLKKKEEIKITEKGKNILDEIEEKQFQNSENENVVANLVEVMEDIKDEFNEFSTNEMLAFIYKSYPEYISNSVKADQLDYEKIFLGLYERGLLGISKIAELMDWSYDDAYKFVHQKAERLMIQ